MTLFNVEKRQKGKKKNIYSFNSTKLKFRRVKDLQTRGWARDRKSQRERDEFVCVRDSVCVSVSMVMCLCSAWEWGSFIRYCGNPVGCRLGKSWCQVIGHRGVFIFLCCRCVCFYSETISSRKGTFHPLFFPASGFFLTRSPLPLFSSYLFSLFLFSHLST